MIPSLHFSINFFDSVFSLKHRRFPLKKFWNCETKTFGPEFLILPSLIHRKFQYRRFSGGQRDLRRKLHYSETKFFDGKVYYPLMHKSFRYQTLSWNTDGFFFKIFVGSVRQKLSTGICVNPCLLSIEKNRYGIFSEVQKSSFTESFRFCETKIVRRKFLILSPSHTKKFRYSKISGRQKGYSTSFLGTVRQNKLAGKMWYHR